MITLLYVSKAAIGKRTLDTCANINIVAGALEELVYKRYIVRDNTSSTYCTDYTVARLRFVREREM